MAEINTYLTFKGDCEAAFNFYKSVFGGEFTVIQRFKDIPSDQPLSQEYADKIMHVSLPIGGGTYLMASDAMDTPGQPAIITGNNFSLSLNTHSEEEATRLFNELSAGGKITMPLEKTFWGAFFGMWTDKFGINWMVNYDFEK